MASRVRVFLGCSLDGFIAGPNDELDWLSPPADTEDTFTPFMAEVGALLMGRRTYEVAAGFDVPWPYGDTPVLVATHRPLEMPKSPSVRPVHGTIQEMVAQAQAAAGSKDVYLDGGQMVRSGLDANLVDELTLTVLPIVLGQGVSLFHGLARRHALQLLSQRPLGGGLVELKYQPLSRYRPPWEDFPFNGVARQRAPSSTATAASTAAPPRTAPPGR